MHGERLGAAICKRTSKSLIAVFLLFGLGACPAAEFSPFGQSTTTGAPAAIGAAQEGAKQQDRNRSASFSEFNDVPIPANAKLDFDSLLVLGAENGWIGRLPLIVGYRMPDMYAFYEREMPKFGWNKITSIRAAISTMTYRRGNRIATITLSTRTTGGTDINFTVAPANQLPGTGTPPSQTNPAIAPTG